MIKILIIGIITLLLLTGCTESNSDSLHWGTNNQNETGRLRLVANTPTFDSPETAYIQGSVINNNKTYLMHCEDESTLKFDNVSVWCER